MNLGENIYRYRTEKNMSQGDLADALDVSRQSVSKWETGSATPELEKLLKMSKLFSISLDELVGEHRPDLEPAPRNLAGLLAGIPPRKVVGTVLLCCAFLTFLILAVTEEAATGLLWAIPFTLCGITCFVFRRHVGVWCAWALYLPLSFIPIEQYVRSDISFVTHLFVQLPILIYTAVVFHREPLELNEKLKWLLGVGYILWFILISMLLGALTSPPALYDGFDPEYILKVITFPLFSALLTTTVRLLKRK